MQKRGFGKLTRQKKNRPGESRSIIAKADPTYEIWRVQTHQPPGIAIRGPNNSEKMSKGPLNHFLGQLAGWGAAPRLGVVGFSKYFFPSFLIH